MMMMSKEYKQNKTKQKFHFGQQQQPLQALSITFPLLRVCFLTEINTGQQTSFFLHCKKNISGESNNNNNNNKLYFEQLEFRQIFFL